jgi:imidazolonepropionase-like amidohydrolase
MPGSLVAYLRSEAGQESRRALAAQYEMAAPNVRNLTAVFAERTRLALQIMADADVRLLFGSDTPSGDGFGNPPGFDGRLELQRWSEAGVPLDRILRAATIDNARAMGLDDEVGSIAVGKRADLLLMSENPLAHANAFDTIEIVFLNGQPIERATLVANGSRVP